MRASESRRLDPVNNGGELEKLQSEIDLFSKELDSMKKNLRELEIRMVETLTAIDLVSSSLVRQALTGLPDKVLRGEKPAYEINYLEQFLKAARKDIKISD